MSRSSARASVRPSFPLDPHGIDERDFTALRTLVYREAGINLGPHKKALVVARLGKRVRELGLDGFGAYYDRVVGDDAERVHMLDCISTNETHFFREPAQFDLLERALVPRWVSEAEAGRRPRSLRVWSAACSTGEEPYSLAMCLFPAGPLSGWETEIVASDLSTRVLDRARAATWPMARASEIPDALLKRFMLRGFGAEEGRMQATMELRTRVRFARVNLVEPRLAVTGMFDAVFCRNVLIYFDAKTKAAVVTRIAERIAPGGFLFLGHAETLTGVDLPFRSVSPNVYERVSAQASERGGT